MRIRVPRDRDGSFEPQLVKKHQRRLEGFDEKVLALYSRGMTTRDIAAHLRELYGADGSHELISKATDAITPMFREWQARPLEAIYPIVYLDALFVSVRDGVQVQKRAFYIAMGVGVDGKRDVLGICAADTEDAKYWLGILNESDRKELAQMLRPMYTAENEEQAGIALVELETKYSATSKRRSHVSEPVAALIQKERREPITYVSSLSTARPLGSRDGRPSRISRPKRSRTGRPSEFAPVELFGKGRPSEIAAIELLGKVPLCSPMPPHDLQHHAARGEG